jgi:hypothetical protein
MKMSRDVLLSETLSAIDDLRQLLDGTSGAPAEFASRGQLVGCLKRMFEIELNLRAEKLPEKPFRQTSGMGRMIVDQWPSNSALGTRLLEIEQSYVGLHEAHANA